MGLFGGSSSKSDANSFESGAQSQTAPATVITMQGKGYRKIDVDNSVTFTDFDSVSKAFDLADKSLFNYNKAGGLLLNSAEKMAEMTLKSSGEFATDTLQAANALTGQIIEAGKYQAGATERIAEAFQSFVDEQNNPNEKNQMILIMGAVGVLGVIVYMVAQ